MTISNVSAMAAIIAGVLKDEATSQNRSASLIQIMFDNEVTYTPEYIAAIVRLTGEDRTAATDKALADIAPEFVGTKSTLEALKAKDNKDRTETDKNAIETINKQLRAARIMFTRAMTAVYGLRTGETPALEVKASKRKTGSLAVEYLKERTGDKIKTVDREHTAAQLIAIGEKRLNEALGKKAKAATTARNPSAAASLADSSKALAAVLTGVVNSKDTKRFDLLTENKELEANALAIVASIIKIECSDEKGVIDRDAVADLINRACGTQFVVNNKTPAKPAAKAA